MFRRSIVAALGTAIITGPAHTATIKPAPQRDEGQGPFARLILRDATLVAGTGAPPRGPVDIVIEKNRITRIVSVGNPGVPVDPNRRPIADDTTHVVELDGAYVLPGFVDMHGHLGGVQQGTPAEYVLKLWLAHGITTVREPGSGNGIDFIVRHKEASAANEITAPRLVAYRFFGQGASAPLASPDAARRWVRASKRAGADGIKFFGAAPAVLEAAIGEASKLGMGTAMHHAQLDVTRANVLDTSSWGLTTMEHWYGLPEALFDERTIQDYPPNYNYNNEQDRFAEAGRLWQQAAAPGSARWIEVRDTLLERDFTLDPTLTIYEASRDLMNAR
ncbi:MAG: amidohydrolase family protein, partial [Pseudomonadota bacterium]